MKRAMVFALVLWSCAACGQQAKTPRVAAVTATYEVSGVVVNAVSGEALAGVTVTLGPPASGPARPIRPGQRIPSNNNVRQTRSAPDGSFAFDHVTPGKYSLGGTRHGFAPQDFDQHDQYASAIVVGPDKVSTGIRFRLQPDASISGTILDDHNDSVMNAAVM